MIAIRAPGAADAGPVLQLNADAFPAVAAIDAPELARLCALSRCHLVVVDADEVLGYALAFRSSDDYDGEEFRLFRGTLAESFLYIDQIAIRADSRSMSLGRRLYAALEHVALQQGAASLCCEVNTLPANPGSLAFHSRLGFLEKGKLHTADGRDVVLLAKPVAEGSDVTPRASAP